MAPPVLGGAGRHGVLVFRIIRNGIKRRGHLYGVRAAPHHLGPVRAGAQLRRERNLACSAWVGVALCRVRFFLLWKTAEPFRFGKVVLKIELEMRT